MIATWFSLLIGISSAQECKNSPQSAVSLVSELNCALAKEHIESFFKKADPCVGMELSAFEIDIPLCETGMGMMTSSSKTIPVEKLESLAGEIVRPLRFNKLYKSSLNRPELAKLLKDLSAHLKTKGIKYFSCGDLRAAANENYRQAKESQKIGECYQLETFGGIKYVFGAVARNISVTNEQQKKIENLFSLKSSSYHLGLLDTDLVVKNRLTIDDLKELAAIRKASELFERSTPLKNDDAGGFFSNLKGEFAGGDQLNCVLEAGSHIVFLKSLIQKGLIQNFEVLGPIRRPPDKKNIKKDFSQSGHVAVLLRSKKTGQEIIYDSWFEKGGGAAHILLPEDWHNLSLDFKNEFNDIVPLAADR